MTRDAPAIDAAPLAVALAGVAVGLGSYESLKSELRAAVSSDPMDATLVTVLGGSFLFYLAEKGNNPKVETYWDALVFISTCLSVGYADVFAKTPAGKAIASAIMTVGPAMSGAILEPPSGDKERHEAKDEPPGSLLQVQRAILGKLDAILDVLKTGRSAA